MVTPTLDMKKLWQTSILEHSLLTPKLHKIIISKPNDFLHQAGQYINIHFEKNVLKPYSIANAPHHNYIELHIKEFNQDFKNILLKLTINKKLNISNAFGTCVSPTKIKRPVLLIAGGCGFAPIKAIIEDFFFQKDVYFPVNLYWGISDILDVYHTQQLQNLKNSVDWFDYQLILNDFKNLQWTGRQGYVTDFIFKDFPNVNNFDLYVNGPQKMVISIYQKALEHNLNSDFFHSDYKVFSTET